MNQRNLEISKRFRALRRELGYTQADFGQLFNLSQDAISAVETGKNKPTLDVLSILHDQFQVNIEWVVLGKEPMFNPEPLPLNIDLSYKILKKVPQDLRESEGFIYIPILNRLDTPGDIMRYFPISEQIIAPHSPDEVKALVMEGDSMQPSVKPGDYVIFVNNYFPGVDGIYAIERNGKYQIKRLFYKNGGDLLLYSENDQYPKEEIPGSNLSDIPLLGKVIFLIKKD